MTTEPSPNARCARCGGAFRCGIDDAGPCPCTALQLPPALLTQLAQRFTGCLCGACLLALAAEAKAASS